jgi:hypothetical protein
MVFSSILISLVVVAFLIVLYQQRLNKTSLKNESFSQLCLIRHEAFVKYKKAKEMKLFGAMGNSAHKMVMIDKELNKRHFLYVKQPSMLLRKAVEINNVR